MNETNRIYILNTSKTPKRALKRQQVFLRDPEQSSLLSSRQESIIYRYGVSNIDGKKVKQDLHLTLSEALTIADEDIKENWRTYQRAFLEGK